MKGRIREDQVCCEVVVRRLGGGGRQSAGQAVIQEATALEVQERPTKGPSELPTTGWGLHCRVGESGFVLPSTLRVL